MTEAQQAAPQIIVHMNDIVGAKETIDQIANLPLDAKLSYRIQRIGKFVEEEYAFFHSLRNKLILKYGEPILDEKKKPTGDYHVLPTSPKYKDWLTSIQSIADEDILFPFRKINVAEFGANALTPKQIADLAFMLEGVETGREMVEDAHLNNRAERRKALQAAALGEDPKDPPAPADKPKGGKRGKGQTDNPAEGQIK